MFIYTVLLRALFFLMLASTGTTSSASYPTPANKYVNDYTALLQPEDKTHITNKLIACEKKLGIECSVVIIDRVSFYDAHATLETFATKLFNAWGIGDKLKNNGVLLLIALQDRAVRIELGAGYKAHFNATAQSIINEKMLPLFKQNKPIQAINTGCDEVIKAITPQPIAPWIWYAIIAALIFFGIIAFFALREALRHDTNYGNTPKETKRWWPYYYLFGVNSYHHSKGTRSHHSSPTGGSFGGGLSSGGGASGRW